MATPLLSEPEESRPWTRIAGPDDLLAAARAAPAGMPLVVAAPEGVGEALGPGWPRALVTVFRERWARVESEAPPPPPPLVLVWECGPAVGLALAALADWPAPPGWTLVLALDDDVPAPAVEALTSRAATAGVRVRLLPRGGGAADS
ncbi:hypothetical protein [Rhodospira trueperi]|uniref:Uncharacterized protein n=1 Tax=Rhodospira trueperi TaxID=69960 RepID=A0A1G7ACC6_9PROT|nr:hypothetical protein [Rhodospira trueperi]SDE11675.1 hypothetical protein SAMN05421720_103242 [Rhodospira trueperi]